MSSSLLTLALAALAVLAVFRWLSRPHTVIQIAGGRAELVRGCPPSGLLRELTLAARHQPLAQGRVELSGTGPRLAIALPGLEETLGQQIRNVLAGYRDRIR